MCVDLSLTAFVSIHTVSLDRNILSIVVSQLMFNCFVQLTVKLEALRDEYMRYATEMSASVLREYHSAVETITGLVLLWCAC